MCENHESENTCEWIVQLQNGVALRRIKTLSEKKKHLPSFKNQFYEITLQLPIRKEENY